jgi:hypothetical protein
LSKHIKRHHPDVEIAPWDIDQFIVDDGPQQTFSVRDCPLCDDLRPDEGDHRRLWVSRKYFESHLGFHMELLAHFAVQDWGDTMPWPRRSPDDFKNSCLNCAKARVEVRY